MSPEARRELLDRGFTRRTFARVATLLTAGSTLPFYNEPALAQLSMIRDMPADAVRINANENPMGPCPEALAAMQHALASGGRYLYDEASRFGETLADVEGVPYDYVQPYAGSSAPLHFAVLAFTSPQRSLVTADPSYEAPQAGARFLGATVHRVALAKSHAHDVRAMIKADANAGLYYVCNPNNPTGTLTPREDIEYLLSNKPAGSVVLLDEAYIHISKNAAPCLDLVAAGKDLIVLRTFSKIYGMAGLRAGAAFARPDLLRKLLFYGVGPLPSTGMAGATASLKSKNLVKERRETIAAIRDDVFAWLTKHDYAFVPSESNKFMLDVKRPGHDIVRALAAENVYIGRVWPAWPTHVRVSIGTREEMQKFKIALQKVMA